MACGSFAVPRVHAGCRANSRSERCGLPSGMRLISLIPMGPRRMASATASCSWGCSCNSGSRKRIVQHEGPALLGASIFIHQIGFPSFAADVGKCLFGLRGVITDFPDGKSNPDLSAVALLLVIKFATAILTLPHSRVA